MDRLQEEETAMKCVICHGDEIKVTDVKEEFTVGNDIVYIPIKVPICKTCGERYYDRRTVQFLEEVEEKLVKIKTDLKEVGKVLMYEGSHFV
jgi:YgiT-type zinc finger domain-containing protein